MQAVKDSWRVVNHRDIIPTVPRLMGYCHVAQPIYLSAGALSEAIVSLTSPLRPFLTNLLRLAFRQHHPNLYIVSVSRYLSCIQMMLPLYMELKTVCIAKWCYNMKSCHTPHKPQMFFMKLCGPTPTIQCFLILNVSCDQVERELLEDGYHGDIIGEVTPDFVLENVVSEHLPCNDSVPYQHLIFWRSVQLQAFQISVGWPTLIVILTSYRIYTDERGKENARKASANRDCDAACHS
jgi:hypothetical protein